MNNFQYGVLVGWVERSATHRSQWQHGLRCASPILQIPQKFTAGGSFSKNAAWNSFWV